MTDNQGYPTEVTDNEATLGFQLALVSNPRRFYMGNPSLMRAVVFVVGPMQLIFKVCDPDGNIEYSHRQYGDHGRGGTPEWFPVLVPCRSAEAAIQRAQSGVEERFATQRGLTIDPVLPSLYLRCSSCHHGFKMRKDFLGVMEPIACPKCGKMDSACRMIDHDSDHAS